MSLNTLLQRLCFLRLTKQNVDLMYKCYFSAKPPAKKIVKIVDPVTGEVKTKKAPPIPRITLLSGDQISVTTLPEAEKLSKRRDLRLVKIIDLDTKTQRPLYKLMTGSEYHAEDLKHRELKKTEKKTTKGEKMLLINSKINQHDLDTQLKRADKWIMKKYEVNVVVSGAGGSPETSVNNQSMYMGQHFWIASTM